MQGRGPDHIRRKLGNVMSIVWPRQNNQMRNIQVFTVMQGGNTAKDIHIPEVDICHLINV